jgi:hypothetical protein
MQQKLSRREVLGGTAAVVGATAGCLSIGGGSDDAGEDGAPESTHENTSEATSNGTTVADQTTTDGSYTVSMEPMGDVEFSTVPETFVGRFGFVVDIAAALDELDSLVAMYSNYSVTGHQRFYEDLSTVSIDAGAIEELHTDDWNIRTERLYELEPGFTAIDPNYLIHYTEFDAKDVERFRSRAGPFLGNESQGVREEGWPTWPDGDYPYLSLGAFTRTYGRAFRKTDRAEAILELNREVVQSVKDRLPPTSERPSVAVGSLYDGTWHLSTFDGDGTEEVYGVKHYRDLGVSDAVAEADIGTNQVGTERMLEFDPEIFVWRHGVYNPEQVNEALEKLEDDPLGSKLSCVDSGRFYVGGSPDQGPIVNTFQTEMLAKQLFPREFGEYPGLGDVSSGERLFDRSRIDQIVRGELGA